MKLGDQTKPTDDTHLGYLARYGVRNICGYPDIKGDRLYATVDELKAMTDLAAKYQITVDCLAPPFLESSFIDTEKHPAVMLAQSPERDRDIEQLQTLIRNCAQAGIPSIKYNMSILGVLRSGWVPGRGDAMYHQWKLSEAHPNTPLTKPGHVDADAFWERITYFLDHVIPVANEYKIRMACHPQDPGVPPEGYQGVNRVLGTVDGLKREPVPRPQLLPGYDLRRPREPRRRDLRRHPLLWLPQEDLQRSLPQHSRTSQRLHRSLPR
jgi:mannonate dehydratase